MKFSYELAIFAFFYLVIIISFGNDASAEPRGVKEQENIGRTEGSEKSGANDADQLATSAAVEAKGNQGNGAKNSSVKEPAKFGHVATDPTQKGSESPKVASRQAPGTNVNESNPLADLFQITDPTMRAAMSSIYGAYKGNDQCSRKAFCMLGNYLKDMPGRDLVFLFMGNYIPAEYSLYYEIFKVAVQYGQNCNVYVCIPEDSVPNDAASAARPKGGQPANNNNNNNNNNGQLNFNSLPR